MSCLNRAMVAVLLLAPAVIPPMIYAQSWEPLAENCFVSRDFYDECRDTAADHFVRFAMQGRVEQLRREITARGGRVTTTTQSTVTGVMPARELPAIAATPYVTSIYRGHFRFEPPLRRTYGEIDTLDLRPYEHAPPDPSNLLRPPPAVQQSGMIDVLMAREPLEMRYDGTGVLLGVIESGLVDFRHADFRNPDGTTRFAAIWAQNHDQLPPPPGYDYGMLWRREDLDREILGHTHLFAEHPMAAWHPTSVTGVAAGNGLATGDYCGVAPGATLAYVSILPSEANLIEAVRFIYHLADSLGMPCVINLSYQINQRVHDGSNVASVAISEMVREKPGRAFVTAAGNNSHFRRHLLYDGTTPSEREYWLGLSSSKLNYGSDVYQHTAVVPRNSLKTLRFGMFALRTDSTTIIARAGEAATLPTLDSILTSRRRQFMVPDGADSLFNVVVHPATLGDSMVALNFDIRRTNASAVTGHRSFLGIALSGNGRYEAWNEFFVFAAGRGWAFDNLPFPGNLLEPDAELTISPPGDGEAVLTAGSFWNRTDYRSATDSFVRDVDRLDSVTFVGRRMFSSGFGGQRNGIYHPTVLAPGMGVPAAIPLQLTDPPMPLLDGHMHNWFGGTSAAAPVLAGAVALFLQKHPDADFETIRRALIETAFADSQTGAVPNSRSGYGKLDIYRFLCWTPES